MAKEKTYITFPDGTEVACVYTPAKVFAVHKPLDSKKDYVVTHVPTHTVVLRTRLTVDAKSAARAFEWLFDLLDMGLVEKVVVALRSKVDYKP